MKTRRETKRARITAWIMIAAVVLLSILAGTAKAWNRSWFDTTYQFDKAVIALEAYGTVQEGKVDSWMDFENSDMIQLTIDGITYMTHSANVILISE